MAPECSEGLVDSIVRHELSMFLAVRDRSGVSPCQMNPGAFRLMREITHGVLSACFLTSYLGDLVRAEDAGRNLMTEKYALMEGLPGSAEADAQRDAIADAECAWRADVAVRFPHIIHADGQEAFRHYLACELKTYSPATVQAYAACVATARREGRNLVLERYDLLMRKLGRAALIPQRQHGANASPCCGKGGHGHD